MNFLAKVTVISLLICCGVMQPAHKRLTDPEGNRQHPTYSTQQPEQCCKDKDSLLSKEQAPTGLRHFITTIVTCLPRLNKPKGPKETLQ